MLSFFAGLHRKCIKPNEKRTSGKSRECRVDLFSIRCAAKTLRPFVSFARCRVAMHRVAIKVAKQLSPFAEREAEAAMNHLHVASAAPRRRLLPNREIHTRTPRRPSSARNEFIASVHALRVASDVSFFSAASGTQCTFRECING